ncbi:MAG: 6-phosphogluconolactonase [Anaerolineales bacterium]|jgi:6-phosphogluconolactonase
MIHVFNDYKSLSQSAAEMFVDLANQSINSNGRFCVALSGGNTPHRTYEILAASPLREKIRWEAVHVFWSDERCVALDDPRSNFLMARRTLLDLVPVQADHIHPILGDLPAALAATHYETTLQDFFKKRAPAFDLILLGLGENAHTASLFPHTSTLDEKERWVEDVYVAEQRMYRVTMTPPLINQAREVVFLVSGAEKASALQGVLEGAYHPHELPAQLIRPNGAHPVWLVDKAAAHKLVEETIEPA